LNNVFIRTAKIVDKSPVSILYEIDDETAVQMNLYKTSIQEIEQDKANAKNAMRMGVPTFFSFDVVQCGENYGIIYENVQSKSLGDLIMENPDNFDHYVDDFVDLTHKLGATHVGYDSFRSIKGMYAGMGEQLVEKGFFTREEVGAVGRMLAAIPERDAFIHSALRPSTLRYFDDELTIYGLRDASYGHPIFETGGVCLSIWSPASTKDDKTSKFACGLDCATANRFWNAFLWKYFDCKTEAEAKQMEENLIFMAGLKRYTVPIIFQTADEATLSYVQAKCRKELFPHVDNWIENMKDKWECYL